jgi:tetratricopeptide (TPR) repeat protein
MKRTIASLALVALAACSHTDPASRFADAKAAFAAEDYGKAREAVLAALEADAGNRDMLLLLTRADLALGDGEGAGRALGRLSDGGMHGQDWNELSANAALLRGQPQDMERLLGSDQGPVAWRLRGEAALAAGDSVAARTDFARGMAAGADFRLAWDYAHMLIDADDIDGADRALAVLRQTGPDRLDTLLTTGMIAERRAQLAPAVKAYTDAANRFPSRPEPLLALADLADRYGDLKRAADYGAHAAAIAPNDARVTSMVVRIADEQGDWEKVRGILAPREASLDLHGPDALAYADALRHLGRGEAARAILQQALSLSPQNPKIRLMLAQCDIDLGDGAGALRTIRPVADSVLAGKPELDLAIRAAGMAHDASLASYSARRNAPQLDAIGASANRAMTALAQRDWAAALAAFRAIPGIDTDADALKLMAFAASRLGQGPLAIGYADRALALDSANPDMVHMAGVVRLNAGLELDTARSLLHQALERDPTNRLFLADYARTGAAM